MNQLFLSSPLLMYKFLVGDILSIGISKTLHLLIIYGISKPLEYHPVNTSGFKSCITFINVFKHLYSSLHNK